jgi:hypothetical protein
VVQWCFDGASPPLVVEVSDPIPAPAGNGKVCYVIYTAESDVAPHFLNGRKGIWVRTDEFSARFEARLANDSELRQLLDRRRLVRERRSFLLERAKKRFDTYARRKFASHGGTATAFGPRLEFCVVPRFPARQLCEQENLKACILKFPVPWRGVLFPDPGSPSLSQHESVIVLDAARSTSIFELNIWGMHFYGAQIEEDHNGTVGIHLYRFVGYVLLFIEHAGRMLQALGYLGPIIINTALTAIRDAKWLHAPHGTLAVRSGSDLDDDVAFSIPTTTEALREKPDAVAMELLRYVLFSVNCSDLVDTPQRLQALVLMGYKFNFWAPPACLRM